MIFKQNKPIALAGLVLPLAMASVNCFAVGNTEIASVDSTG